MEEFFDFEYRYDNVEKDLRISCFPNPFNRGDQEDIENKLDVTVEKAGGNWDNIQRLIIDNLIIGRMEDWKTIFQILQRKVSHTNLRHLYISSFLSFLTSSQKLELVGLDNKWAMLPTYFANIRELNIYFAPITKEGLPLTCESIGRFQSLTHLSLDGFLFTVESLYKLAKSIENLPSLEWFRMNNWFIDDGQPLEEEPDQQHHPGLEALFCALGNHPTLRYPNRLFFRRTDYEIPQYFWNILNNGPTFDQELKQLKRQLPEDHTERLTDWVEALIAVKDRVSRNHKQSLWFWALQQMPPDAWTRAAAENIENQLPAPPMVHAAPDNIDDIHDQMPAPPMVRDRPGNAAERPQRRQRINY